jgi:hypothetical protein
MAKVKQLPAGKSKADKLKEAAKRKAAAAKKASATAKSDKSKATAAKAATQPGPAPTAAPSAQAPVSSPNGSLVSAQTWEADQARLQSAVEDADTTDELNSQDVEADTKYTSAVNEATKTAAQRKLELAQQKDQWSKAKGDDYKNLDTNMAYRGAARSSAADRGLAQVKTAHTNTANQFANEETNATNYVTDVEAKAKIAREATKGYVTKRRGTLAERAAARGVLSVGSAPVDNEEAGIEPPTMLPPSTPSVAAKAAAKTSKASAAKAKAAKTAAAKAKAAAAKRRIAKKGKK